MSRSVSLSGCSGCYDWIDCVKLIERNQHRCFSRVSGHDCNPIPNPPVNCDELTYKTDFMTKIILFYIL
jgi:hypothetical protein